MIYIIVVYVILIGLNLIRLERIDDRRRWRRLNRELRCYGEERLSDNDVRWWLEKLNRGWNEEK